jgi:hypothetical protein
MVVDSMTSARLEGRYREASPTKEQHMGQVIASASGPAEIPKVDADITLHLRPPSAEHRKEWLDLLVTRRRSIDG